MEMKNELIHKWRCNENLSQAEVACSIGVNQRYYSAIENGKEIPTYKSGLPKAWAVSLASLIGKPFDEIWPSHNGKLKLEFLPLTDQSISLDLTYDMEGYLFNKDLHTCLYGKMQELTNRQRSVLQYRFGLAGHEELSAKDTAKKLGITKARVQYVEAKALRSLRWGSKSKYSEGLRQLGYPWEGLDDEDRARLEQVRQYRIRQEAEKAYRKETNKKAEDLISRLHPELNEEYDSKVRSVHPVPLRDRRWFVHWLEPVDAKLDFKPIRLPLSESILVWWHKGFTENYALMYALVKKETESEVLSEIEMFWHPYVFRSCDLHVCWWMPDYKEFTWPDRFIKEKLAMNKRELSRKREQANIDYWEAHKNMFVAAAEFVKSKNTDKEHEMTEQLKNTAIDLVSLFNDLVRAQEQEQHYSGVVNVSLKKCGMGVV